MRYLPHALVPEHFTQKLRLRRPTVGCGLDGWLRLSYNDRIEAEYREVLARPHFAISPARREAFLAELRNQDTVVAEPWADKMPPDMDDLPFLEVARQTSERMLVTGNARHFPASVRGPVTVLTPREAWERLNA